MWNWRFYGNIQNLIEVELTIGKSRGLRRVSFSSSGAIATTWSLLWFALLVIRRLGDERGIDEKLWERGEEHTIEREEEEEEKIFVGDRTTSDGEGSKLAEGSDAMGNWFSTNQELSPPAP